MENEFYEFALEQFQFVRTHAVREKDGELYVLGQNYFYEKIYPKVNWTSWGDFAGTLSRSRLHWEEKPGKILLELIFLNLYQMELGIFSFLKGRSELLIASAAGQNFPWLNHLTELWQDWSHIDVLQTYKTYKSQCWDDHRMLSSCLVLFLHTFLFKNDRN